MPTPPLQVSVRRATSGDIPAIESLIGPYVAQRVLLPRNREELARLVPNGFIAERDGRLVGFAAVEVYSAKLAEILCLAVASQAHGQGIGKRLVQQCVDTAKEQGVRELMAISSSESFFRQCGFDFILPDEKKVYFIPTGPARTSADE